MLKTASVNIAVLQIKKFKKFTWEIVLSCKSIFAGLLAASICFAVTGTTIAFQDQAVESATDEQEEQARDEKRRYDEADINSNGTISREEFKIYVKAKLPGFVQFEKLLKLLDADNDGALSGEEFANRRSVAQKLQDEPVEFQDQFNERFMDRFPQLDTEIKGLVAFDENGKALNFESFKGKHTVVVFGCLT